MAFADRQNRATLPFVKNSKVVFTLPLGDKIRWIKVVLRGSITLSAVTAQGTVFGEGAPVNLIDRILVHANPQDTRYPGGQIVDRNARSLLREALFHHQGKFVAEQSGSTLGNGAAGTYNIYLSIPIYFADPVLRARDVSTALNTDLGSYSSVQVEVRTADILNCLTGFAGTVDYSQLMVDVVDDRVSFNGDTNVLFQEDHQILIGAAAERMLDQAMPLDGQYLSWLVQTQAGAQATLADTILQKMEVRGNPIEYVKWAQDIRQDMLDDEWIDPSQSAAGLYFIDWTDGVLANSLTASSLQTRFKVLNPSGANQDSLLIATRRIFAPAPAASK